MSPDITSTNLHRGAMRREDAISPPVPPPLPLDTPSEVERRERRLIIFISKVGSKYSVTTMKGKFPSLFWL